MSRHVTNRKDENVPALPLNRKVLSVTLSPADERVLVITHLHKDVNFTFRLINLLVENILDTLMTGVGGRTTPVSRTTEIDRIVFSSNTVIDCDCDVPATTDGPPLANGLATNKFQNLIVSVAMCEIRWAVRVILHSLGHVTSKNTKRKDSDVLHGGTEPVVVWFGISVDGIP